MFDRSTAPDPSEVLTILARAEPEAIRAEAEAILPALGDVEVLQSRTGLVMLPARDTVEGTEFHLGEVLVAEAHVRLSDGTEGYGMIVGRDLERAMAMALIDAALAAGVAAERLRGFVTRMGAAQADADRDTLRRVEATRVDMETF
ncbi:phosphonate C-P lyase system protein PhnG [Psychromarinibacter sp. C21-152]|uniref:Phosphonate C-P lyase system protein PhnG n=1 Tax=Psychromarinibacter sediminicola TaxID=3033385 RepID=A0AAE3TB87_9RHOB|nr:phosphonate C-P lyase system protein PhnG [Psychromarinibacter sediminicola]MDF0602784.1 phosphonate C-P lyase system protein PhnG [Psychromarinibacter sediminicola]